MYTSDMRLGPACLSIAIAKPNSRSLYVDIFAIDDLR